MLKRYIIVLVLILVLSSIPFGAHVYALNKKKEEEANADTIAPKIECKNEDTLFLVSDDEINYRNYFNVSDNSGYVWLNVYDCKGIEDNEHIIVGLAKDTSGNMSALSFKSYVYSTEEWDNIVYNNTEIAAYKHVNNYAFKEEKGYADIDAFNLAMDFIGMHGGCNEIAQAFINRYFGEGFNIDNYHTVSYEDAKPGDIIYYTNGGLGQQHYAVYLGGDSALHGNYTTNHTAVINCVYMNHGSTPQFRRLIKTK